MTGRTAQQELANFDETALADRHDRQLSLLEATGALGPGPYSILDVGAAAASPQCGRPGRAGQ